MWRPPQECQKNGKRPADHVLDEWGNLQGSPQPLEVNPVPLTIMLAGSMTEMGNGIAAADSLPAPQKGGPLPRVPVSRGPRLFDTAARPGARSPRPSGRGRRALRTRPLVVLVRAGGRCAATE